MASDGKVLDESSDGSNGNAPLGIVTESELIGTCAGVQFAAVFQSLLTLPFQTMLVPDESAAKCRRLIDL